MDPPERWLDDQPVRLWCYGVTGLTAGAFCLIGLIGHVTTWLYWAPLAGMCFAVLAGVEFAAGKE